MTSKKTHHRRRLAANLGFVVTFVGALVMAGWIFDIAILKSILPHWVTMKFTTALSFFWSGILLISISRSLDREEPVSQIMISVSVLIIMLLMGILLGSTLLGIHSGVEDLFVREKTGAVMTSKPGRPSVGTMINFLLISAAGIGVMFRGERTPLILSVLGWLVTVVGLVAVVGYILNLPLLYYTIENVSTAMAMHTALLFIVLGTGLFSLRTITRCGHEY